MATITLVMLGPSTAVTAMAMTKGGRDRRTSMTRIVASSTTPPWNPAITPDVPPRASASRTASVPT
jgi:hypothetical protein